MSVAPLRSFEAECMKMISAQVVPNLVSQCFFSDASDTKADDVIGIADEFFDKEKDCIRQLQL